MRVATYSGIRRFRDANPERARLSNERLAQVGLAQATIEATEGDGFRIPGRMKADIRRWG